MNIHGMRLKFVYSLVFFWSISGLILRFGMPLTRLKPLSLRKLGMTSRPVDINNFSKSARQNNNNNDIFKF